MTGNHTEKCKFYLYYRPGRSQRHIRHNNRHFVTVRITLILASINGTVSRRENATRKKSELNVLSVRPAEESNRQHRKSDVTCWQVV